jgi:hypothetical protein
MLHFGRKKLILDQIYKFMNELIACCGLDCEACEARIAYVNNDDKLRAETAEKWKVQYGAQGITPEMINCSGCRVEGPKIGHCHACKVRLCVADKGYITCGDCADVKTCELVKPIHGFSPQALNNLLGLS